MIHKIYTVFDAKAEAYLLPFMLPTKGLAIRSFSELVNDPNHNFGKYPEDYTLFECGAYDDSTCKFDILPTPLSLGVAIEFKNDAQELEQQLRVMT